MTLLDHTEEKYNSICLDLRNSENTLRINVKWDGCVDIENLSNGITFAHSYKDQMDDGLRDYIHICNLKEFIEQLQEAYKLAKEKEFEV